MAQAQPTAEKTPTVTQSAEPRNRAIANLPSVIVEGALAATSAHPASHTNLHHEDAFFSTAPAAADHDEDIFELPMSRAPRRAVTGVVVMLTASAVLTAAFVAYYESSKSASKTTQTQVVDTSSDSPAEKPVDEATAQPQAPVDEPSPTPSAAAADEIPSKDFAANEVVEAEVEPTDVPEVDQARTSAEQSAYDGLVATGVAKQRKGKRKEALAAYEAALALAPGASEVLGKIALMHLESNQMKPAQEYAEKAVAADANNAEGWIVLGAAKQTRGDAKGAREAYQQCANLPDPRYATECRRMAR